MFRVLASSSRLFSPYRIWPRRDTLASISSPPNCSLGFIASISSVKFLNWWTIAAILEVERLGIWVSIRWYISLTLKLVRFWNFRLNSPKLMRGFAKSAVNVVASEGRNFDGHRAPSIFGLKHWSLGNRARRRRCIADKNATVSSAFWLMCTKKSLRNSVRHSASSIPSFIIVVCWVMEPSTR